jgi:hypothetical protein
MSNGLEVGINYVNKTTININKLDYSEVIKLKSATLKTSINIITGNGYNVVKTKITTDVSKLNFVIGASGMYGQFCGTDDNENYIFKVLQNTTIIDNRNNTGVIIPTNTKVILPKNSSNKYMYKKINKLINNTDYDDNGKFQTTITKIANRTYDSITNIGKPEGVMPPPREIGGGQRKKTRKSRISRKLYKKRKTCKNYK